MAKKLSPIESLQEAKERVRKSFRPSEADPVVRFIENGKMGLRHLFSEKVVDTPTRNFIEMPDAEEISPTGGNTIFMTLDKVDKTLEEAVRLLEPHLPVGTKIRYPADKLEMELSYYPPFDNLFSFKLGGKTGLFNARGEIVLPAEHFRLSVCKWWDETECKMMYLTDALSMVEKDENGDWQYGFVGLDGKVLVPAKYGGNAALKQVMALKPAMAEIPWMFYEVSFFSYKENGKCGLQTLKGEKLTEAIYDRIYQVICCNDRRYFTVRMNAGFSRRYGSIYVYGLLNDKGEEVLSCVYDYISIKSPGVIVASRKNKSGIFNLDGSRIVPCSYDCEVINESVITATTAKDVSLFNLQGQIIIETGLYRMIEPFRDGIAKVVTIDDKVFYIDLWGNKGCEIGWENF